MRRNKNTSVYKRFDYQTHRCRHTDLCIGQYQSLYTYLFIYWLIDTLSIHRSGSRQTERHSLVLLCLLLHSFQRGAFWLTDDWISSPSPHVCYWSESQARDSQIWSISSFVITVYHILKLAASSKHYRMCLSSYLTPFILPDSCTQLIPVTLRNLLQLLSCSALWNPSTVSIHDQAKKSPWLLQFLLRILCYCWWLPWTGHLHLPQGLEGAQEEKVQ